MRHPLRPGRALLLAALAGGILLGRPSLSPAQTERSETPACKRAAVEMDGELDLHLGDPPEELETLLARVRDTYRSHEGIVGDCAASLAINEVVVLLVLDRFEEAQAALATYKVRYEDRVSGREWMKYHLQHGYLLSRLGNTQESTEAYALAAALAEEQAPYYGAIALLNASLTFAEIHDEARARTYLRLADSLAQANLDSFLVRETLGEIRVEQALSLQRAIEAGVAGTDAYSEMGLLAQEALALLDETDFQAPDRAMAHLSMARAALRQGNMNGARAALERARPHVADSYESYVVVEQAILEGEVAEAADDLPEARAAYARAVDAAREELLTSRALDALLALGQVEEAAGDDSTAAERYRQAIALGETIRERQGVQDWSLSASEQTARPYARMAALLARQGHADEAFKTLDASRARRLFDLRASLRARRSLSAGERQRVDSLLDALDGVRLAIPNASPADRAGLDAEATRLQRLVAAETRLNLDPPPPLDLGTLVDTLGQRQQVLISYLLDGTSTWAFVVTEAGVAIHKLAATPQDIRKTTRQISAMWREEGAVTTDAAFRIEALEHLYQMLIAPIREALPDGTGVVTVPPAELASLPFGMLVEPGGSQEDYAQARYLIRQYPVSTELAAALLVASTSPSQPDERLVFGRTSFDNRGDLPFVKDEVQRVQRTLPSPTVRLDGEATEAALLAALPRASLVHLASHATADPEFPLYSQILLADDTDAQDDGTLHLYELEHQPLNADLVVLSGCSTARGQTLRGEGMIGLQYGVRAAGAKSAVATLWPVDDRATVQIMGAFYDALGQGMSKDRALQAAQIAYLQRVEGLEASPFYWAPAVLSGDVTPVPWDSPSRLGLWLLLLGGLAAAGTVAWRFNQRLQRA